MSEDIWAFLSKGAGPDDEYLAEIRLRRRKGALAVLRVATQDVPRFPDNIPGNLADDEDFDRYLAPYTKALREIVKLAAKRQRDAVSADFTPWDEPAATSRDIYDRGVEGRGLPKGVNPDDLILARLGDGRLVGPVPAAKLHWRSYEHFQLGRVTRNTVRSYKVCAPEPKNAFEEFAERTYATYVKETDQ